MAFRPGHCSLGSLTPSTKLCLQPAPLLALRPLEVLTVPRGSPVAAAKSESEQTGVQVQGRYDVEPGEERSPIEKWLNPDASEIDDVELSVIEHFNELRERIMLGGVAIGLSIAICFAFSKELVQVLEAPVAQQGVKFLQLSPGEFFFTSFKVAGYTGLLVSVPSVIHQVLAYVMPGLTKSEKKLVTPAIFASSALFFIGVFFSYVVLTPAALGFFVSFADGAVESLWSIEQYFDFVVKLMIGTGLCFQVPMIQVALGQIGVLSSAQMFGAWKYVLVGSTVAAAVITPSTDPFTQALLAGPLVGLYLAGSFAV